MDGSAVFRWATTSIAAVAREACARAGIELRPTSPHSSPIRRTLASSTARRPPARLDPRTVVADDVARNGNTSAASVPLALARLLETGRLESGDPVLLLAFGAGLSWAGQVVLCP